MWTQLLFLKWGISLEEPYEVPEKAARPVFSADRFELEEEMILGKMRMKNIQIKNM